jgi:hypothetical protein
MTGLVNLPGVAIPTPLTVTPTSQTVVVGSISWIAHNPAAGYSWSISPADCVANSGSGSGDGSTIAATCNVVGAHTLTVTDGTTTVSPTFLIIANAPLTITPVSVSLNRRVAQTFTASGGVPPYSWSAPSAVTTTGSGATFTTSWSAVGTYTVTLTDSAPTPNVLGIQVTVTPLAMAGLIGNSGISGRASIQ